MKPTAIAAAVLLALVPATEAWRIRLYNWEERNPAGDEYTNAGPGGTGRRCHNLPSWMDRKASSMAYYHGNKQNNPTTTCTLNLYDGRDCTGRSMYSINYNVEMNLVTTSDGVNWNNRARSYMTRCGPA